MKKTLAIACIFLSLMAIPLFANGEKEKANTTKGETTLTYWANPNMPHPEMVELFEKAHPGVKINLVTVPAEKMRELITAAVSSGTGPDIFYFEVTLGQVEPLLDANLVIPLDAAAKKYGWNGRLTDFALAEATHRGTLWAVPNEIEYITTWYNKKIFKELGVTVPTTWQEQQDIAAKAEKAGYQAFSFGVSDKWSALHRICLGYQWNDNEKTEVAKALAGEKSFNDPKFVEGLSRLMELDGKYWPNAVQIPYAEAFSAFLENKVAMFSTGTWLIADIMKSNHPDDFGMFIPINPATSKSSTVAGAGGGWYINSSCKNQDLALEFLDLVITEEAQKYWLKGGLIPPINIDVNSVEGVPALTKEAAAVLVKYKENMGYYMHHFLSSEQVKWINDGYQELLMGTQTPKQFADKMQKLGEEAKDEGFKQ
jgi:raffinose/stachyose/melibiose transport system substrate-binding protein